MHNKSLLDAIPDTIFHVNQAGVIIEFKMSKKYPLLLPAATVVGQSVKAVLPHEAVKGAMDAIAETLNTGEMQFFEYDLVQNNKTMFFEARVTKAGDEDVLIIIRDISERRRAEACDLSLLDISIKVQEGSCLEDVLSLACERIMAIFGVRLLWIGRKDPDAVVKLFTARGKTSQYLKDFILSWNDTPDGNGPTGAAIRTGKFHVMDIEDPRLLLWREQLNKYSVTTAAAFPLKADGQTIGALTIFADDRDFWTKWTIVHLTNFAEQIALAIFVTTERQRLKLLTTGLESAANAIVITNRAGDIKWCNPAFLELNGYSSAEAMTANIRMIESGQHSRSFYKSIRQYVFAGRIWHGEIINRRRDGSRYTAEMTVTPVRDETGKIVNFISIIQDVTKRKQAESEMLEAREAVARAERLSALGIMAAGIAHEINQPLNSLKVMADGMLYWYKQGKVPEIGKAMDNLQNISKQAGRIDAIIKHIRSFIQSSEFTNQVPCDLNASVEDSLLLIGTQLRSHDIEVKTDLAVDLPPILGSSTQLEQIIINLLVNAMQALDTVKKSGKQINIVTRWEKEKAFLVISDNGPGIHKEIKGKIFEPFFTTKPAGEGMGLGLSVIHSIVASYGGQINVTNNKAGGGAVFRIEFPVETTGNRGM